MNCGMPKPSGKDRPYNLHTNRELGLMLAGKKPLAVFSDGADCFPDVVNRYLRMFNAHVAAGRMVRRDHFSPPSEHRVFTLHTVLFALPGEEWRIDAMIDLRESGTWSRDHERREGELLGYDDWMNDYHLAQLPKCE